MPPVWQRLSMIAGSGSFSFIRKVYSSTASALSREEQGTTRFRLTISADGRVSNCTVTGSSGSSTLDNTTCRIMRSRARFTPARDNYGNPTTDTHSGSITWRIQD